MRVWYDSDSNVVVVEGTTAPFAANSIIWQENTLDSTIIELVLQSNNVIISHRIWSDYQDANGNSFQTQAQAEAYLTSVINANQLDALQTLIQSRRVVIHYPVDTQWIVDHNFVPLPNVSVFDNQGREVGADVQHVNPTQVKICFSAMMDGYVILN